MAQTQHLSEASIRRILHAHNLKPHLVETFKLSRDQHFVEKLYDVVGLYLNPPDKAVVLCVDEKSQIQALDRTQPLLPLRPGIPARQTHDYERHGTTTLFAALSMLDGRVIGDCMPQHRHQEFIRFLKLIDTQTPVALDLHLIVDNYGTHPPNTQLLFASLGGLSSALTPEQQALLGCGAYYGTSCDRQGIDLLNAEASALFQSFPGFEGSPLGLFTSNNKKVAQPGTVGFQGGPVCTRFERGKTYILPGCRGPGDPGYNPAIDGAPFFSELHNSAPSTFDLGTGPVAFSNLRTFQDISSPVSMRPGSVHPVKGTNKAIERTAAIRIRSFFSMR